MRKFFLTILAFVYIASSIGATINMHYCMGKLANWDIGHNISKTCGKCGMEKAAEKNNGCCKDEKKFVKNLVDQQVSKDGLQVPPVFSICLPANFIELPAVDFTSVTIVHPFGHCPPRCSGVPVYIRNCVFLI